MSSYIISPPVLFDNSIPSTIDFEARDAAGQNTVENFVTTTVGDIVYCDTTGPPSTLTRLAIGGNGDVLTVVGGLPAWASGGGSLSSIFLARALTSVTPIPTSQSGGGNANTWFTLNSTYVTWNDTTAPSSDADGVFTPATGTLTIPSTGLYILSGQATFAGNNDGAGVTTTPTGTAVRQVRLQNLTSGTTLAVYTKQAESFEDNSCTLPLSSGSYALTAGDQIVMQVRHDVSGSGTLAIRVSTGETFFSGVGVG